ncbi:protein-associating with the carboxyl-terminal domain of ezrin [Drosophila ficusphila]|uniref:protein-associating with the carboxyl-terminal domain of ezrin n=1 Tax=Drosophila ficusphila TaxID=30025 RepID=UPI0007E71BC0|nr:protein-associating with the carboxyl-terminal domain of ezrin [Drosophila ficusphila]
MGNEGSKLKGLTIEKNAVEINDFWTLYNAELPTTFNDECCTKLLSIFQSEVCVKDQLWSLGVGPTERAIKNLKIYRHPHILKYVTSWEKSGRNYLATEKVVPLNKVLDCQTDLEKCLGLRTILCSLIFLTEKALARHLNISTHNIYVTDSGNWRLSGFEYVWTATEVNKQLIDLARTFLDPNICEENFEQYSFAVLCEHVLSRRKTDSDDGDGTPHVHEFREYCGTHLKHQNTKLRPRLSAILLHPYFNHEFILIHSFLFELPLKSVQERQHFFRSLIQRLRSFDEEVVASQLASDLVSRMVLLDSSAQQFVIPYVFRTKAIDKATSLFSPQIYVQYLMPHILKMFRMRDAQIRLILLDYFADYVRLLGDEQLESEILPHLRLGLSDTNDVLVAKTLKSMAALVHILGGSKVLGGDRRRFFSDGRPHAAVSTERQNSKDMPRSITPVMNTTSFDVEEEFMVSGSPMPTENNVDHLPRRLSPDGGEDEKNVQNLYETSQDMDPHISPDSNFNNLGACLENTITNITTDRIWSDWGDTTDELKSSHSQTDELKDETAHDEQIVIHDSCHSATLNTSFSTRKLHTDHKGIDDLNGLDIQVQSVVHSSKLSEYDFFKDMEPYIETKISSSEPAEIISSRLAAATLTGNSYELDTEADKGWGHDEQDEEDIVWGMDTALFNLCES